MPTGKKYTAQAALATITSADADTTYSTNEVTLINELKADFNLLAAALEVLLRDMRDRGDMDR